MSFMKIRIPIIVPKMLEEECIKMFGTKSLNDEHDCNVVSMNPLKEYP